METEPAQTEEHNYASLEKGTMSSVCVGVCVGGGGGAESWL